MEILIKLDKRLYKNAKHHTLTSIEIDEICDAIANGTPLPKGHGRLIDADEVVKEICIEYKANSIYELSDELRLFIKKYLNEAPTILKPTVEYMIENYVFFKK